MKVPFVDLKRQYQKLKAEIDKAIQSVVDDTAFISGKYAAAFEEAYAQEYGVKHCISVANGTDAIYVSLKALEVGPGDEVITVANSWISTSEAVTQTGGRVVFVDIEPDYYTIDVTKIEEKITPKSKGIIPVHLYGQPAKMEEIQEICQRRGLFLLEDCAQAHFAKYKGKRVGTFGIAGTFSFYPGKNLGAYGDAGGIITNDDEFARKTRMFANHGAIKKHDHEIEGINSRMDGIQAAVLKVKLPHIHDWNKERFLNAKMYSKLLSDVEEIKTPSIRESTEHIFHLYVIRTERRDELLSYLKRRGIASGIHYPKALPLLRAYRYLNHTPSHFPVAAAYQDEILSIPMFPELTSEQIEYVVDSIKGFVHSR